MRIWTLQFDILENLGKGKKDAVNTAMRSANPVNIIFTTDADCILPQASG
jgi:hypothetical protein